MNKTDWLLMIEIQVVVLGISWRFILHPEIHGLQKLAFMYAGAIPSAAYIVFMSKCLSNDQ